MFPAGLTMHASILAYMVSLVEDGKITVCLNPANSANNQVFIQEYVANLLKTAFPHLQEWVQTLGRGAASQSQPGGVWRFCACVC